MFFVVNKDKLITYIVSIVMVVLLFTFVTSIKSGNEETILTSSSNSRLLPIYKVKTENKNISLTMNCAWNADDIDKIIEVLDKTEVKITFFVVGDWVDKYPEAVKKIAEHGHEIGTHSNTHPHVNNLSLEENISEIKESSEKIEKITGQKPDLYRAPYGEYNNTVIQSATDSGYFPIQWSLDTLDYTGLTGEEMWQRLNNKLNDGDIILMHNGTEHTADSLEMLISNIKNKGFNIVKVSDLIYKSNYSIDLNGTQILNE